MNVANFTVQLLLGGLLGIVGQGIRVLVGLKKLNQSKAAAAIAGGTADEFNLQRLLMSVFIGFIAGVLGMLVKYFTAGNQPITLSPQLIVAIIAGGYSGVDFIEGILNNNLPKTPSGTNNTKSH